MTCVKKPLKKQASAWLIMHYRFLSSLASGFGYTAFPYSSPPGNKASSKEEEAILDPTVWILCIHQTISGIDELGFNA